MTMKSLTLFFHILVVQTAMSKRIKVDRHSEKLGRLETGTCNAEDVAAGCAALGGIDGEVTSTALADTIFGEPAAVTSYFKAVGILEDSVSCHTLCAATITAAPRLLGVGVPKASQHACLDKGCIKQIRTDTAALGQLTLHVATNHVADVVHVDEHEDPATTDDDVADQRDVLDASAQESVDGPVQYSTKELIHTVAGLFQVFLSPNYEKARKAFNKWKNMALGAKNSSSMVEVVPVMTKQMEETLPGEALNTLTAAILEGDVWISSALRRMSDKRATDILEEFFGRRDAETAALVRKMLFRALHAINHLYIAKGARHECKGSFLGGTIAYVEQETSDAENDFRSKQIWIDGSHYYVVNICDVWFKAENMDTSHMFYGTMIHEATHHFATTDVVIDKQPAYGEKLTRKLAEENPEEALTNADNYLQFVYHLVQSQVDDVSWSEAAPQDVERDEQRVCTRTGTLFGASRMCRRILGGEGCDNDKELRVSTEHHSLFSPVCYPFCKQVESIFDKEGLRDCNDFSGTQWQEAMAALGEQDWQSWGAINVKAPTVATHSFNNLPECLFDGAQYKPEVMCKKVRKDPDCDKIVADMEANKRRFSGSDCLGYCKGVLEAQDWVEDCKDLTLYDLSGTSVAGAPAAPAMAAATPPKAAATAPAAAGPPTPASRPAKAAASSKASPAEEEEEEEEDDEEEEDPCYWHRSPMSPTAMCNRLSKEPHNSKLCSSANHEKMHGNCKKFCMLVSKAKKTGIACDDMTLQHVKDAKL